MQNTNNPKQATNTTLFNIYINGLPKKRKTIKEINIGMITDDVKARFY